jgi:hypothetical protein
MGNECKRDTEEGFSGRGRGNGKGIGVRRIKICYLHMYGNNIKKPTKYCL